MKLPCEIVVTKVLPQLRALVAVELKNKYELQGKIIATLVGTTEAAVSQYLHGVRAVKKDFLDDFPELVTFAQEVATELYENREKGMELTQKVGTLCVAVRKNSNFEKLLDGGWGSCTLCLKPLRDEDQ